MKFEKELNSIKLRYLVRTLRLDAEDEEGHGGGGVRLPYGLCKKFGIEIEDDWKPRDAWNALESGTGLSHDYVLSQVADYGHTRKIVAHKPTGKYKKEIQGFIDAYDTSKKGSGGKYDACHKLVSCLNDGEVIDYGSGTIRCEKDDKGWSRYFFTGFKAGMKHNSYEMTRSEAIKILKQCADESSSASSMNIEINHPDYSIDRKRRIKSSTVALIGLTSENYSKSRKYKGKKKVKFDEKAYSKKNKDNAVWICHLNPRMSEDLGEQFARDQQGDMVSKVETDPTLKSAFHRYTAGSGHINFPLRGTVGWGVHCPSETATSSKERANIITQTLDKSEFNTDFWVQRGASESSIQKLFGVSDISKLRVGKTAKDEAFTSCAIARDTGFLNKGVIVNTYCPRGTKALYINHVSKYKGHEEYIENEILLQRGTSFRITRIEKPSKKNDFQWVIDCEVAGQEYTEEII